MKKPPRLASPQERGNSHMPSAILVVQEKFRRKGFDNRQIDDTIFFFVGALAQLVEQRTLNP